MARQMMSLTGGALLLVAAAMMAAPIASASGMLGADPAAEFYQSSVATEAAQAMLTGGRLARRQLQQACTDTCKLLPKQPICGTNKKTYDSACYLTCANAKIGYLGKCVSKPCLCPAIYAPVCGGGKTYISECFAKCDGAKSTKSGYCTPDCSGCPSTKSTVCGLDGKTYDNVCKAICGGTTPYYSGTCDKRIGTCACASTYDPVCATIYIETKLPTGTIRTPVPTTYASPCLAKCQGNATTWTKGVCKEAYTLVEAPQYNCGCSLALKPVCVQVPIINTTTTIYNECTAKCYGYKVVSSGICKDECLCPGTGGPVCANGKPYKSACQARCKGATTWTDGECAQCKSCPTPMSLDDYACGADGMQYTSKCAAECAGTTVANKGICKYATGK